MPIPDELKPFLEGIPADQVTIFDNLLTKTPDLSTRLKEGVLRQSDYDRKMNASKADVEAAKKRAKELEDWYAENEPIHKSTLADYEKVEKSNKELQERLRLAEAARQSSGGDEVNAAELELKVKEQIEKFGYVSRADMDAIIATEAKKMAETEVKTSIAEATKDFWSKTFPAAATAQADIAEVVYDWKAEFGENIDRAKLDEIMKQRSLTSFKDGAAALAEPIRSKREFDKKVKEEALVIASGMTGGGMAGGAGGAPVPMGAVQMRMQRDAKAAEAAGISNSKLAAVEAAQELRAAGKF